VEALIALKVAINPLDRWRNSPLDDALRSKHADVAGVLEAAGAVRGATAASIA
jgi:hypothetical protein